MNFMAMLILWTIEALLIAIIALILRRPFFKSLPVAFAITVVVGMLFHALGWQGPLSLAEVLKVAIALVATVLIVRRKQKADAEATTEVIAATPTATPSVAPQQQFRLTPGPAASAPTAKKVIEMTPLDEHAGSGEAPKS